MGACCSDTIPKGTAEDRAINSKISKHIKNEKEMEPYIHKIILLGPGDSGKTTLLKQIRMKHASSNVTDIIDSGFVSVIRERVISYMKGLCEQSIKLNIEIEEKNVVLRDYFNQNLYPPFINYFNAENVSKIKELWSDHGIQETFARRNEYQNRIPDNAEYFISQRLDDIVSDNYEVSIDDYLRIRMRTTGFMSETFMDNLNGVEQHFVFTDVGGQQSERNKWINIVHDDIDVVLYIMAISEYDIGCFEDANTNRLTEALNLFKTIVEKGFCNDKTVQIFFNKIDLLKEKLSDPEAKTIDEFHDDFPNDKDPRNMDDVVDYVLSKFETIYNEYNNDGVETIYNDGNKKMHSRCTSALDTEQIRAIAEALESDVVEQRLKEFGF